MKKQIILFFLLSLFLSCKKTSDKTQEIQNTFSYAQTFSESNRIIIRPQKERKAETEAAIPSFATGVIYEAKNPNQLKAFDNLLDNAKKTDYRCCPQRNFSITFYDDKEEVATYYADITEFKNKVRIYEGSFQFSFIIDKQLWEDYLAEIGVKKKQLF